MRQGGSLNRTGFPQRQGRINARWDLREMMGNRIQEDKRPSDAGSSGAVKAVMDATEAGW